MEKNSIMTGIVLGVIMPVIGYFLVENLFNFLTEKGVMADVIGGDLARRLRTIGIVAICFNLIPFEICRKHKLDDTMRGIVFPTLIYVGFWIYKYFYVLFT